MNGYREVFRLAGPPTDPGRIFYTITRADIGKRQVATDAGLILLADVLGRVLRMDIGRRIYRVPGPSDSIYGPSWIWQAESITQRDARQAAQQGNQAPRKQDTP